MKTNKKALVGLIVVSMLFSSAASFGMGWGRGGGRGRGWGRGRVGWRGRPGWRRRPGWGRGGVGFGIGFGGRRGGFGIGFGTGFWGRPGWRGWRGRYWGPSGLWLSSGGYWGKQWPQVYNETGERIKFYVSDRYRGSYTLTIVTESGVTETFPNLERPDMRRVEVFIDRNGNLQIAPR